MGFFYFGAVTNKSINIQYNSLYGFILVFLLGKYPDMEWLTHIIGVYLNCGEGRTARLF